jgi:hypothetical protein
MVVELVQILLVSRETEVKEELMWKRAIFRQMEEESK